MIERMTLLTFALTKGRILKETLPLLAAAGIEPSEDIDSSRKLVFNTNRDDVRLLVLRGSDVPTYVHNGAADLGVTGKDTLMEFDNAQFYEWLDLDIARCRLMTAAIKGVPSNTNGRIRVATKYVKVAKAFYAARGQQAEIIKLYGGMELAPIMGLADEIVDIVDTGNTLKANGLDAREHICDISSRLIVNRAAMKLKHDRLMPVIEDIRKAVIGK